METAHHVEVGHAAEKDEEMDQSQEDHHEAAAHWITVKIPRAAYREGTAKVPRFAVLAVLSRYFRGTFAVLRGTSRYFLYKLKLK